MTMKTFCIAISSELKCPEKRREFPVRQNLHGTRAAVRAQPELTEVVYAEMALSLSETGILALVLKAALSTYGDLGLNCQT
jgi:hypothetical protein